MSHFYGVLQGNRGEATRCGTKSSGVNVTAAGWGGAIEVTIWHNPETGKDMYHVWLRPWQGSGGNTQLLASGVLDSSGVTA